MFVHYVKHISSNGTAQNFYRIIFFASFWNISLCLTVLQGCGQTAGLSQGLHICPQSILALWGISSHSAPAHGKTEPQGHPKSSCKELGMLVSHQRNWWAIRKAGKTEKLLQKLFLSFIQALKVCILSFGLKFALYQIGWDRVEVMGQWLTQVSVPTGFPVFGHGT